MVVHRFHGLGHSDLAACLAGVVFSAQIAAGSGLETPAGTDQLQVAKADGQDQT